jgi:preprotein translocase subunit YajC
MQHSLMLSDLLGGLLALTPSPEGSESSPFGALVPILFMVGVFYFILFRPMRKRQKQMQNLIGNLKSGDKVVTNGGMMGTVIGISDRVIQLRIADGVKVDFTRNAIAGLQTPEAGEGGS